MSPHPSIWSKEFTPYLNEQSPWQKKEKKPEPILAVPTTRPRKVVNLVSKIVPETQDQDERYVLNLSLSTYYKNKVLHCLSARDKLESTRRIFIQLSSTWRVIPEEGFSV